VGSNPTLSAIRFKKSGFKNPGLERRARPFRHDNEGGQ
jgi:hypothetical protein